MLLAFCLLATTACDENAPTGPTVPINRQFTLAPQETALIEGTGQRVRFVRVSGDSRCPADAICVWIGDAVVELRVFEGTDASDYQLHTIDVPRAAIAHRDLRIMLVQLQPYPFSNRTIQPSDYRATLEVRR
jgi:hypothetical protein